ncbi:MAG: GntR family transcriptional regulator [Alphaproteobacteria bacterium]|nr:GntR family transcriptional regulator [Alphaproteobacteria bacterium]
MAAWVHPARPIRRPPVTAPATIPFEAVCRRPKVAVPPGAWDCHAHVFGPFDRFPLRHERAYTPGLATGADWKRMHGQIGIARGVLVQASVYGTDNRATLAALAELGPAYRGVAVVSPDIADDELKAMHKGGIRGIRLSDTMVGAVSTANMEKMGERLKPLGWHIQLLVDASTRSELVERATKTAVPVVWDHLGGMPASKGTNDPGYRTFLDAFRRSSNLWVKVSGPYLDKALRPPYAATTPLAQALVAAAPDRCVWGTDWPHPAADHQIDDAGLMELLAEWVPDAATRQRILVDNPPRLYGA